MLTLIRNVSCYPNLNQFDECHDIHLQIVMNFLLKLFWFSCINLNILKLDILFYIILAILAVEKITPTCEQHKLI